MIEEMFRLLSQLASLPMGSPEADAIHEQIAALRPKPYTLEDFEGDLQKRFDPHGIEVRVDQRDRHAATVITRKGNYAFAMGVATHYIKRDQVDTVAAPLLRRWGITP